VTAGGKTAIEAGLQIIVPVWGEAYTRLFAELCLPTLLAPGNIPALPHRERHVFAIYTTPDDRRIIEAAPAFALLSRTIAVEFHPVRARVGQIINHYDVQSDCFRRAIRRADAANRAMVFLTPDLVMADGSLRGLARIAGTGARAVLGVGIRLDKAPARERLLAYRADDAIAIVPRDLVRLALGALHPIARAHMFHGESDAIQLSNLYWRVGGEGLVARCFHLHPFLVYPRVKNAPFSNTVDGDYLEAACPDPADAYIITDSDEFSAWELSDADRRVPTIPRTRPLADFLTWVRNKTTPRHRALAGHAIRIHCGMTDAALWQQAERESGESVAKLLALAEQGAGSEAAVRSTPSLRFMTPVRSVEEARSLVDTALPSALAPGNIPRLPDRARSRYTIAAPAECARLIEASPAFAELREQMPAEIRIVSDAAAADPAFAAGCRIDALRDAAANDAVAFFMDPDAVVAGTSLDSAWRISRGNIRAVVAPRLRLAAETAALPLRECTVEGLLSVGSEELIRLAMAHLHPAAVSQLPGAEQDLVDPDALLWPVEHEGLVIHAFAFDPVLIHPRHPPQPPFDDLLASCGLRQEEIGVFRESAPFVQCRLTSSIERAPTTCRGDFAAWVAASTAPFQRLMFRHVMRLSAVQARGPRWAAVEAMAGARVKQLLDAVEAAVPARGGN
jgi:hypothetical protein